MPRALTQLVLESSGPLSEAARAELSAMQHGLLLASGVESRLRELAESMFAIASLDFSQKPTLRDDGTVLDGLAGCVLMLSEEIPGQLYADLPMPREGARTEQHPQLFGDDRSLFLDVQLRGNRRQPMMASCRPRGSSPLSPRSNSFHSR